MAAILFGSSVVLLIASFFFWFRDGLGRSLRTSRRVVVWVSLFALTGAVLLFVKFLWMVGSPEFLGLPLAERVEATGPIVRSGFWLTTAAFVSCWFATFKTTICVAISSGVMWLLWAAAAIV
jgi:hypothetical protein